MPSPTTTSHDDKAQQQRQTTTSSSFSNETRNNGGSSRRASSSSQQQQQQQQPWPEDDDVLNDSFFIYRLYQRWTYSYMTPLLAKGRRQERDGFRLTAHDLFLPPVSMTSSVLVDKFQQYYHHHHHHHDAQQQPSTSTTPTPSSLSDDNNNNNVSSSPMTSRKKKKKKTKHGSSKSSSSNYSLFWRRTLWNLAAPTFVPAGFFALLTIFCQVSVPLLVRQLLILLEERPQENILQPGVPLAVALFAVVLLNGLANHRHRHLAVKSGIVMRAALVNMLYHQVLILSPRGRIGLTSGEVTTLVALDTQKLLEVTQEGHLIWSLPLAMCLVTILLVLVMGPVTLVGILVLLLFLPCASWITSKMLQIRNARVALTDQRIQVTSSMLQGIQVTKLHNYEDYYYNFIMDLRNRELHLLRKEVAVWAMTLTLTVLSPALACAATFSAYVLMDEDNILTAAQTFTVLLLFSALRFPINYAGRLLGKAAQAMSAVERIVSFLERETQPEQSDDEEEQEDEEGMDVNVEEPTTNNGTNGIESSSASPPPLQLENAAFCIGAMPRRIGSTSSTGPVDEEENNNHHHNSSMNNSTHSRKNNGMTTFTVSEFNLSVHKGQVLAVCGPVGSGKSTLIAGIIRQASPVDAVTTTNSSPTKQVSTRGHVAYVSQSPFILNATFRENILFGLPLDQEHYEKVLDACCLHADIEQLGVSKDLTEIGERGVTLSGGQKQRVSLARAAYSRPDLVLLDDPLSALDAGTSKLVFENLINGPNAYFSDAAVVLVTHAAHFLNRVDRILLIVGGENKFHGTWNELAHFHPVNDVGTLLAVDSIRSSVQEAASDEASMQDGKAKENDNNKPRGLDGRTETRALVQAEVREHGLSSVATWLLWFRQAGGIFFIVLTILFLGIDRTAYVAVEYWLARWTDGAYEGIEAFGIYFPPQTDGLSAQSRYLIVYSLLLLVSCMATAIRSEWVVTGGSRAATKLFSDMLASVLRAPLSYFESQPQGRILSRFTYDMEVVDVILTQNLAMFMVAMSWFFAGVVLMSSILNWMILALLPVTFLYWLLLLHYRKSGVDLQRLDALSRSPIQAMVTEVLDGSPTIRVFKREPIFVERFRVCVDRNSSAMLNFISAQRWLGVRIELLGSLVVLVSSVLVVCLNETLRLEPGIVGLLTVWSSNFTLSLGFLIDFFGESEAAITAVERIDAMKRLPAEKEMETDAKYIPPTSWPEEGAIEFKDVCLRYREGLPLALNNLSFRIPPGKSCGVVGRTGAGKSSLSVALFRIVEIESGRILLDGRDLGQLGLSDVRGRPEGMSIIPQDPFLAGSTLRECIDPLGKSSDESVLEALRAVRMASADDTVAELASVVEEGGSNYSVGERQLINLARALLSKPKVLVLDEATAATDGETDAFIQRMLRTRFKDTTLFTVAHRLHTIMDYDLALVMDQGSAVELGSPAELLSNASGTFSELVNATGLESAKALRAMAKGDVANHPS